MCFYIMTNILRLLSSSFLLQHWFRCSHNPSLPSNQASQYIYIIQTPPHLIRYLIDYLWTDDWLACLRKFMQMTSHITAQGRFNGTVCEDIVQQEAAGVKPTQWPLACNLSSGSAVNTQSTLHWMNLKVIVLLSWRSFLVETVLMQLQGPFGGSSLQCSLLYCIQYFVHHMYISECKLKLTNSSLHKALQFNRAANDILQHGHTETEDVASNRAPPIQKRWNSDGSAAIGESTWYMYEYASCPPAQCLECPECFAQQG